MKKRKKEDHEKNRYNSSLRIAAPYRGYDPGTTDCAYLQMMGYLAAYIALDGSDYINNMQKLYQGVTEDKSCIIYERICLYQSVTEPKTEDEEYEFLVKDYGAMSLSTFNRVSF